MKNKNPLNKNIIDVRTKEEYDKQHILGSTNIPLDELRDFAGQYFPEKNTRIFVCCSSGYRSKIAKNVLINIGYTNVVDMGNFRKYL